MMTLEQWSVLMGFMRESLQYELERNENRTSKVRGIVHDRVSTLPHDPEFARLVFPICESEGFPPNRFGAVGDLYGEGKEAYASLRTMSCDEPFVVPYVAQYLDDAAMEVVCKYWPRLDRLRYERKWLLRIDKELEAVCRVLDSASRDLAGLTDTSKMTMEFLEELRKHDRAVFSDQMGRGMPD